MAVIKVDLNNVRNENIDLLMFRNDLNRIINELDSLRAYVPYDVQSRRNIDMRLKKVKNELFEVEQRIINLYKMVNYSMDEYSRTEYELCRKGSAICSMW